jgi:membrane protein involved in colicin uptake
MTDWSVSLLSGWYDGAHGEEQSTNWTRGHGRKAPDFYAVVVSPGSFSSLWDQARSFRLDWGRMGKGRIKRKRKGHAELSRGKSQAQDDRTEQASKFLIGKGEREKKREQADQYWTGTKEGKGGRRGSCELWCGVG